MIYSLQSQGGKGDSFRSSETGNTMYLFFKLAKCGHFLYAECQECRQLREAVGLDGKKRKFPRLGFRHNRQPLTPGVLG